MSDDSVRQCGNRMVLESTTFKICKSIMAPKRLTVVMSTNLPRGGPKWKSAKYGRESGNDSKLYEICIM